MDVPEDLLHCEGISAELQTAGNFIVEADTSANPLGELTGGVVFNHQDPLRPLKNPFDRRIRERIQHPELQVTGSNSRLRKAATAS